jgi:hypothetical protein
MVLLLEVEELPLLGVLHYLKVALGQSYLINYLINNR